MPDKTQIQWTDATWNPIRGCSRVSEGCRNCYAEGVAARFSGPGLPYEGLAQRVARPDGSTEARWTGKVIMAPENVLTQPLRWAKPRRIFVNSMSDLFHESVPDSWIDQIFAVMALCPQHTFQILTKRPERMWEYFLKVRESGGLCDSMSIVWEIAIDRFFEWKAPLHYEPQQRVLPNVWLGVSIEDQTTADQRVPILLDTPAALRFVSAEPLLGPVDLTNITGAQKSRDYGSPVNGWSAIWRDNNIGRQCLDWVICGGESGRNARPMHRDWARSLRDQCAAAEVQFFFKQWGEWRPTDGMTAYDLPVLFVRPDGMLHSHPKADTASVVRVGKKAAGDLLDGVQHHEFPEA